MPFQPTSERYLVIGGSGFLGSHVVEALLARGEKNVSVYDIVMPLEGDVEDGVTYHVGDVLDETHLFEVMKKDGITTVFHTVSPIHESPKALHFRVNIEGTRSVVGACKRAGIQCLVYTSSTGAVWVGGNVRGATEDDMPLATTIFDNYGYTKARAEEMVIQANDPNGMRTCAIRPCGMIGPRDKQGMWKIAWAFETGDHKYKMGKRDALNDITYVGNVADAHLLAADKIHPDSPDKDIVSGEAFFITDDKPVPHNTYPDTCWRILGDDGQGHIHVPIIFGYITALLGEIKYWLTGKPPLLSWYAWRAMNTEQWYDCSKAKKLLGYKPRVSLEDGCARQVEVRGIEYQPIVGADAILSLQWWIEKGAKEHAAKKKAQK